MTLVWVKRLWRCMHPECEQQTCLRARWVGRDGHSVAAVACDLGLGWATVMAAVADHGSELIGRDDRIDDVDAVGLMRPHFCVPVPLVRRSLPPASSICTVANSSTSSTGVAEKYWPTGLLIDPPTGPSGSPWLRWIRFAATDRPSRPGCPTRCGCWIPSTSSGWDRPPLTTCAAACNNRPTVTGDGATTRCMAAQELRAIYACRDRDQAATRLYDWAVMCIDSQVPELGRLARTLTTWCTEFLAYFTTGRISNGPTEAVNLLIKKILRVGHGFRNFHNYRLRLLLHCGITGATSRTDTTTRPPTTIGDWLRRAAYPWFENLFFNGFFAKSSGVQDS